MDDEHNNADFPAAVEDVHPTLRPAPDLTLQEFHDKATELLGAMLEDHEEQTGVEVQDWDGWVHDLTSAYVND